MTKEDALKSVVEIISGTISVAPGRITPSLSIGGIMEWNSVANLEIILAIEENLGMKIPTEDLFELTSVESIVNEVMKLKGIQA